MLENYESMVRTCYAPLIEQYNLSFAAYDGDEFFLVGNGFALYVFVDRRDKRSDIWHVSLNNEGYILTRSLMYIQKNRYSKEDYALYGFPTSIDDKIRSDMLVDSSGLLNHCQDILSGDKTWLTNYPDQGDYIRHVARFLAPYFQQQGYYIKLLQE